VALSDAVSQFIEEARARVERALSDWLPSPPGCPALLSEAMRYSVMAGGKRLRPILVLSAADAVNRDRSRDPSTLALPAACAVEFIHTYSLIHDDLPAMDNDTLRRGRPTLHVVYGDGVAILAGDALQAAAFELLAREPITADPELSRRKIDALRVIGEAAGACGMVGGQTIDLQAAGLVPGHPLTLAPDMLRAMHVRKTGALIRAAAVSGAIMGGADEAATDAITHWATEIGLAFQIVDDILDVEGDASALGKTVGKDAADDKPTYPSLFGLNRARAMAAECADHARTILADARLQQSSLPAIAEWVLTRKN
jgi:geranylgeranyl pyrophosphate synthase